MASAHPGSAAGDSVGALKPERASALRRGLVPAPTESIGASYQAALDRAAVLRDPVQGPLAPHDLPAMVEAGGDLAELALSLAESVAHAANGGDAASRAFICSACVGGVLPGALLAATSQAAEAFELDPREAQLTALEARVRASVAVFCFPEAHPLITGLAHVASKNLDVGYIIPAQHFRLALLAVMAVWRAWHGLRLAEAAAPSEVEIDVASVPQTSLASRCLALIDDVFATFTLMGRHNPAYRSIDTRIEASAAAALHLLSSTQSLPFWAAVLRSIGKTDSATAILFQCAAFFPGVSRFLLDSEPRRLSVVSDTAGGGLEVALPDLVGSILGVLSATTHSALTLERCTGLLALLCGGDDEELARCFRRCFAERDALLLLQPAVLSPSPTLMLRTCMSIALIAADPDHAERAERSGVLAVIAGEEVG